jgi:hypothetical protein
MKRTVQLFTILLFSVCSLTAFSDLQASASNPLLTEYLQLSNEVKETTASAEGSGIIMKPDETYNYACSPKLEECTVYNFIDE